MEKNFRRKSKAKSLMIRTLERTLIWLNLMTKDGLNALSWCPSCFFVKGEGAEDVKADPLGATFYSAIKIDENFSSTGR